MIDSGEKLHLKEAIEDENENPVDNVQENLKKEL